MKVIPRYDISYLHCQVTAVGGNKRLKLANLRKVPIKSSHLPSNPIDFASSSSSPITHSLTQVLTGTLDYLRDVVGMQLSQFPLPDINKVIFLFLLT